MNAVKGNKAREDRISLTQATLSEHTLFLLLIIFLLIISLVAGHGCSRPVAPGGKLVGTQHEALPFGPARGTDSDGLAAGSGTAPRHALLHGGQLRLGDDGGVREESHVRLPAIGGVIVRVIFKREAGLVKLLTGCSYSSHRFFL